jgi:hypothetical protein|tara:strand:+ start:746 stop:988 length:243 start_codon:yes stop_codon:yes gene_type:complete
MITNYINKDEFQQKVNAMKVKLHMEDNRTLTWVIYISLCIFTFLLIIGVAILFSTILTLFIVGLPLAFIEGIIKGYKKDD